jgi:hypothetical protein
LNAVPFFGQVESADSKAAIIHLFSWFRLQTLPLTHTHSSIMTQNATSLL